MWQFALLIFFISSCIFTGIMLHDSRTLWSGASLLFMMICLAVWPAIGNLGKNTMGITLYAIISFVVAYVLLCWEPGLLEVRLRHYLRHGLKRDRIAALQP